ncbi:MAG: ANTAR domain-containing protein [Lachnospiraceae bacterium]|nr:ANTAR domain-containing protein [Candidatus Equihabitans merdae]
MAKIIVAFSKIEEARQLRTLLVRNGFEVVAVCTTGDQVISHVDNLRNGLVICGYQLGSMIYREIYDNLPKGFEMLLMAKESRLPSLQENNIVCLAMPLKVQNLLDTVSMMTRTIDNEVRRRKKTKKVRSAEDEKVLNEAKLLLMNRNNMTEPEAFRYIQKTAMNTGTELIETALMVLELFGG